jgi:hypothetical protein
MLKKITSHEKKGWVFIFWLAIFIFGFGSSSLAFDRQGTFELSIGNYSISEPRFKAVYHKGGLIEGIGLSVFIIHDIDFFFEMKGFYKSGELTYTKERTHFLLLPISLGFRYSKPLRYFCPYAGLGIDYYFYMETNPIQSIINYTRGFHFRVGSYVQLAEKVPIWLNFRLKYTKAKTEENNLQIELGGIEYGLGLVFVF